MNFSFSASYVALWALAVFQGLVVLAVLRQLAELHRFMERGALPGEDWLPVGSRAPEFTGQHIHSGDFVSSRLFDGQGAVILFLSPGCTACKALVESVQSSAGNESPFITAAICNGESRPCEGFRARLGVHIPLLLDPANEIGARYGISGFPTAVVVDKEQKIRAYGHPQSAKDLKWLFERNLDEVLAEEGPSQTVVESRPKFSLPPGGLYERR